MANGRIHESTLLLMVCTSLLVACQGAPSSYNLPTKWREDNNVPEAAGLPPVATCDPATGRCWGWLPAIEPRPGDAYAITTAEEDLELSRAQLIHARDVDQVTTDAWHGVPRYAAPAQPGSSGNQVAGRLAKKDVFMSRSWGAGGMPFSVLYMRPRNHSPNAGSSATSEGNVKGGLPKGNDSARKSNSSSQSANGNRLSARNGVTGNGTGGNGQGRRHYSTIPQLFVSYGWGPSGK